MFTQLMPPEFFNAVAEFSRINSANRDFMWWAETLITEETKELQNAIDNEGMDQVFKESADLFYVVAGFYNCMPANPSIMKPEDTAKMQEILKTAWETLANVSQEKMISMDLFGKAFALVHASNMSKLDDDGNPVRREDGKILKGPNYTPPDMSPIVAAWEAFIATNPQPQQETEDAGQSD